MPTLFQPWDLPLKSHLLTRRLYNIYAEARMDQGADDASLILDAKTRIWYQSLGRF
jgi:hypothetical protein